MSCALIAGAVNEAFVRLHEKGLIYQGTVFVEFSAALDCQITLNSDDVLVNNQHPARKAYILSFRFSPEVMNLVTHML